MCCKQIISDNGLCNICWDKITFSSKPCCAICSYPFEYEPSLDMICGYCIMNNPQYDKSLFIMKYDEFSKNLIQKYKYYDQIYLSSFFAKLMSLIIKSNNLQIDYIIPIPLHKKRLFERKFNQSAILSKKISEFLQINHLSQGIIKIKNTPKQSELSEQERILNSKGVYHVNTKYINLLKGKNILIVDDVYTTGSTINECSKVLKKEKVNKIYAITIAKTLKN